MLTALKRLNKILILAIAVLVLVGTINFVFANSKSEKKAEKLDQLEQILRKEKKANRADLDKIMKNSVYPVTRNLKNSWFIFVEGKTLAD